MEGDISRGLGSGIMADQVSRSSYVSVNYLRIPPSTFLFQQIERSASASYAKQTACRVDRLTAELASSIPEYLLLRPEADRRASACCIVLRLWCKRA